MYLVELEIKATKESNIFASYLDLLLLIAGGGGGGGAVNLIILSMTNSTI